jgi:predicted dinucleotide-binding enzyme
VVKAFNHIYAAQITTDGRPAGAADRRALVIAGNDFGAKATVARLLDQFELETVDAGPLKEGWRIQRDTPGTVRGATPKSCVAISRRRNATPT